MQQFITLRPPRPQKVRDLVLSMDGCSVCPFSPVPNLGGSQTHPYHWFPTWSSSRKALDPLRNMSRRAVPHCPRVLTSPLLSHPPVPLATRSSHIPIYSSPLQNLRSSDHGLLYPPTPKPEDSGVHGWNQSLS
ncbi:unnamed protein product [Arctogadus glacialis]